ncbi:MAG: hypothetical protein V2A34_12655 [Lentisphaerota bacterium]
MITKILTASLRSAVCFVLCFGFESLAQVSSAPANARFAVADCKDPEIQPVVQRGVNELNEAQRLLQSVEVARENKRVLDNGIWTTVIKDSNTLIRVDFQSETGPANFLTKRVFSDAKMTNEISGLGFDLYYDSEGQPDIYSARDSKLVLYLYPDGKLKELNAILDNEEVYEGKWGKDSKLISGKTYHRQDDSKKKGP